MQDLNDLYYFAKVVEAGGFAAAGRLLGIPKSRLSRRIAELEERLGARLLQRTTRQLKLTAVGERYLRHCQAMLLEAEMADEAVASMSSETPWPIAGVEPGGAGPPVSAGSDRNLPGEIPFGATGYDPAQPAGGLDR